MAALALSILFAEPLTAATAGPTIRDMQAAYRIALMEEVCARHVAGDRDNGLRAQARRLPALVGKARRHGLGPALLKTKREGDYFQSVADWVCGRDAGVVALRTALDHFERSIDMAIRVRGTR